MIIRLSGRAITNETGGNTTYARKLFEQLTLRPTVTVSKMPSSRYPVVNLALENLEALHFRRADTVLHYTADTGCVIRPLRGVAITTVHGIASQHIETGRTYWQEKIWRARVGQAIKNSDRVITVSQTSAKDIAEVFGISQDKIDVIYHGIDKSYFSESPTTNSLIELANKDFIRRPFALYVGNIEPRKNVYNLALAFESERLKKAKIPLIVAGRPAWNSEETLQLLKNSKNVIYLGAVSHEAKIALMKSCSLFLFPSLYEGFGFPVLEALASGSAVLTSDRGALSEIRGTSMLFNGLDSESMEEDILAALEIGQTDEDKNKGIAWARRFTWEASVDQHLDSYAKALNQQLGKR